MNKGDFEELVDIVKQKFPACRSVRLKNAGQIWLVGEGFKNPDMQWLSIITSDYLPREYLGTTFEDFKEILKDAA